MGRNLGTLGALGVPDSMAALLPAAASAILQQAGVVFSTRQVNPAYSGACWRVFRTADGQSQDIGFVNGVLDTTALSAFIGSGDGDLDIWYGQSGGVNATAPATRPRVVSGGVIQMFNGRPAVNFQGTGYLTFTAAMPQPLTVNAVAKYATRVAGRHITDGLAATPRVLVTGGVTWLYFAGAASASVGGVTPDLNPHVVSTVFNGAASDMRVDGVLVANGNPSTQGMATQTLGAGGGGVAPGPMDGLIGEFLAFPSALSSTARLDLLRNQGAYFGITVS